VRCLHDQERAVAAGKPGPELAAAGDGKLVLAVRSIEEVVPVTDMNWVLLAGVTVGR
jgi:hypothetical protein